MACRTGKLDLGGGKFAAAIKLPGAPAGKTWLQVFSSPDTDPSFTGPSSFYEVETDSNVFTLDKCD
jgi:hypothetical protein